MSLAARARRLAEAFAAAGFDATGPAILPTMLNLRRRDRDRERLLANINGEGEWYRGL